MSASVSIETIKEDKYPRDVRKAINKIIAILKRPNEIVYGDVEIPQWDQGDNMEKITLPNPVTGASGSFLVCHDNGDGTYSQLTATFVDGLLTSLE